MGMGGGAGRVRSRAGRIAFCVLMCAAAACGDAAPEPGSNGPDEGVGGIEAPPEPPATVPSALDAFDLEVGTCFDDWSDASNDVTTVPAIDCTAPHDNEVYATFDLEGEAWPGERAVLEGATRGCFERFESAIGTSYEASILDYLPVYPSEVSWQEIEDRRVICAAYHVEYEKLTGSVLGSGI